MSKVTLNSLDQKLSDLIDLVKSHVERDEKMFDKIWDHVDGTPEHPGLVTRLDRLEQKEASRTKHIATLWAAIPVVHGLLRWIIK